MKHIRTLSKPILKESIIKGGCGECKSSCQSATKTEPDTAHQKCEK